MQIQETEIIVARHIGKDSREMANTGLFMQRHWRAACLHMATSTSLARRLAPSHCNMQLQVRSIVCVPHTPITMCNADRQQLAVD